MPQKKKSPALRKSDDVIIDEATEQLAEYVGSILATDETGAAKAAALAKVFESYSDHLKSNIEPSQGKLSDAPPSEANVNDRNNINVLQPKLEAMVSTLIASNPTLRKEEMMHYLLHNAHGRRLAEHLNNISKKEQPMDIFKLLELNEQVLMAQVTRRDGETYAKSFSRKYEQDIEFRKQWAELTDAKLFHGYRKSLASLTPTSTEVGNTNSSDDSAEAVRLLGEMAEAQGRKFEQVFSDPANRALANRTYTIGRA